MITTQYIFDASVALLLWLGSLVGMSYEAVNVWLFCVLLPVVLLSMLACIIRLGADRHHYRLCWELAMETKEKVLARHLVELAKISALQDTLKDVAVSQAVMRQTLTTAEQELVVLRNDVKAKQALVDHWRKQATSIRED